MEEEPVIWEPLVKYLSMHPDYYVVFQESTSQLFYRDGPLPLPHRHYLALMAAARHRCQFLFDLHRREFLRLGGTEIWLDGIDHMPAKIRRIDTLNKLLAHQPWLLQAAHLEDLSRCASPDNWSLSELMQGAIVLSHIHSLCSFVKGCGIVSSQPPSPTLISYSCQNENSLNNGEAAGNAGSEVAFLMARMEELSQSCSQSSQEDKARHFADIHLESCKLWENTKAWTPANTEQPSGTTFKAFSVFDTMITTTQKSINF